MVYKSNQIKSAASFKVAAGILLGPADFPRFRFWICFRTVLSFTCLNRKTVSSVRLLKDNSGVGVIVDYSRDYTVVNGG